MAMKSPPYLLKAVKYVGDDMMSTLLVTSRPVDFMYDWFSRTKYGFSVFSVQMIGALFPSMHFASHLRSRLEGTRSHKAPGISRSRYYMRPRVNKTLPDYIAYVETTYPIMHARIHCGVTALRSSCDYYAMDAWKFQALLRLFLDYVYGQAPNFEDIEVTPTSTILHFEGGNYVIQEAGKFDRNFDWTALKEDKPDATDNS